MRLSDLVGLAGVAAAVVLGCSMVACGQEAPAPGGPPPASSAPPPQQDDTTLNSGQTIRVRANLVNTYFSVRDKGGYLTGLHKEDCQVYENKELQTIRNFTQEKTLPLTIGILVDTSGSQMNVLPLEKDAGSTFLKDMITPKDEAFLISFDINVNLLSDYTSNTRELRLAMEKAEINTGAGTGSITGNSTPKGTLLFDAVYLAAHDKLRQEAGRKVLVLLTDGGDQGSQLRLKDAIEAGQKSNAIVYVILISDTGGFGFGNPTYTFGNPAGDMDKLARETGGRVINIGRNAKKLDDAFAQISDELRTQYLVSYVPKNGELDGTFRTINITCGKDAKVQARKGYYATSDSSPE